MSMRVIKLTVLIIDFDDLGADGVKEVEVREVEWSDDHPLNIRNLADAEYRRLFEARDPHLAAKLRRMREERK